MQRKMLACQPIVYMIAIRYNGLIQLALTYLFYAAIRNKNVKFHEDSSKIARVICILKD